MIDNMTRYSVLRATEDDDMLVCPMCNSSTNTHVDSVVIDSAGGERVTATARGEDEDAEIEVVRGMSDEAKHGRRHSITLVGLCEECGRAFTVRFRQHKGTTFVGP